MMLYFLMGSIGWLVVITLLVIMIALYIRVHQQLAKLRQDMTQLKSDIERQKGNLTPFKQTSSSQPLADDGIQDNVLSHLAIDETTVNSDTVNNDNDINTKNPTILLDNTPLPIKKPAPSLSQTIEPDERSFPIVTSIIHSIQNWFLGGNLVVRVGVLVLLVGVILLLRLLSEFIEIPIGLKLLAIGIAGLALAGLGLKLAPKRFAYGITLQGAGLATAYLTSFFAYSVYQVMSSLPSFIMLGILSAVTVALAVRQNAFPLALLALSGGFFAPILTSEDTGSLTVLFSYYLLLNVTIAVIAHYRPWKVLNLFGAGVTFGLAYYWGLNENLTTIIDNQRWTLVTLVALHVVLYLFVVIRYAQQLIAYNNDFEADNAQINQSVGVNGSYSRYLFPIDIGLLFSVPILAFGLFSALLHDIEHALTLTSAILAAIYLGLGWTFIQRSQRYALITEGMLALGFGFLALVIPLALNAEWIAFGWSVQGLALVWFGRRSLRAWSVLLGLLLQLISIGWLLSASVIDVLHYPTLALTISALSTLASAFILRASNSPVDGASHLLSPRQASEFAKVLGIREASAQHWLASINSQSMAFQLIWQRPALIRLLTFAAMTWLLYVLVMDLDKWFYTWQLTTTALIAIAALSSLFLYYAVNHYRSWSEIREFSHGLLLLFYAMLICQLPQKYEFDYQWKNFYWSIFITLVIGWLIIGQLWLKTWYDRTVDNNTTINNRNIINNSNTINNSNNNDSELKSFDSASWLGTGIIVIAELVHYQLPDSQGVVTILVPIALMLVGLWLTYRQQSDSQTKNSASSLSIYWLEWQEALLDSAKIFVPLTLCWVIFTNFTYNGVIWGLPYIPLINLYDVTLWLVVLYGLGVYLLRQHSSQSQNLFTAIRESDTLLIVLALIGFWIVSSMLIRTLHAFIGTPLWVGNGYELLDGAWSSEQVQTGLTILWTLLALVATIIASRYLQRALWFMGIGLLGVVVLKLVAVDLSQTEAIWRVISFLGAGSLILLIGYLAPLPPAGEETSNQAKS